MVLIDLNFMLLKVETHGKISNIWVRPNVRFIQLSIHSLVKDSLTLKLVREI